MQILQPEVLDLGEVVASLEPMLRRLIRGNIALQTAAAPELWPVAADRSQLEQVVMNLVVNARDAMPPPAGGTLRIEAANAELPQDYPESHPGIVPGPYVSLAVSDTGQGMDEATRKRVFEPFFTTKELGKGTGLGLATVYGIVKQSGGYITVQSAPGQGACFKVFLPRAIPPLAARVPVPARKPEPVDPGHLHVLLVEDEPALRRALELMLRRQGCQVTVASGGAEALRLIEQGGVVPNFLLTDLVMPEMSGDLLAERVRELFPGIPVLPMSGYVDDSVLHGPMLGPGAPFLQKPFTSLELADAIREAIQAAPHT